MKIISKALLFVLLCSFITVGGMPSHTYAELPIDVTYGGRATATYGSAYTSISGSTNYGTVSATFTCYLNGVTVFRQGMGAGGVNGASVIICYAGEETQVSRTNLYATHTVTVEGNMGPSIEPTNVYWNR